MLVLCDSNHQEIAYESNSYKATCPLCAANKKVSDLEDDVAQLEQEKEDAADRSGS